MFVVVVWIYNLYRISHWPCYWNDSLVVHRKKALGNSVEITGSDRCQQRLTVVGGWLMSVRHCKYLSNSFFFTVTVTLTLTPFHQVYFDLSAISHIVYKISRLCTGENQSNHVWFLKLLHWSTVPGLIIFDTFYVICKHLFKSRYDFSLVWRLVDETLCCFRSFAACQHLRVCRPESSFDICWTFGRGGRMGRGGQNDLDQLSSAWMICNCLHLWIYSLYIPYIEGHIDMK